MMVRVVWVVVVGLVECIGVRCESGGACGREKTNKEINQLIRNQHKD